MPVAKEVYRVGITGSYGGLNLGDEAILQSIITQLRKDVPKVEITVFSRDAEDTKRRHGVERSVPVRKLSRAEVLPEVERLDLLILGGGGILYDADARTYLREVSLAREKRVPVMVYAIGAGPLNHAAAQDAVRDNLADAVVVTVREKSAHRVLEEAGLHRDVVVTADPALLLKPEPLPRGVLKHEGLEGRRRRIGMAVREPGVAAPDLDEKVYHALLANAPISSSTATTPTWYSCLWSARCSTRSTAMRSSQRCCARSAPRYSKASTPPARCCPGWASSTSRLACGCTS
jgi:polysaccharide pyruvyl transferase WcaK-like protein